MTEDRKTDQAATLKRLRAGKEQELTVLRARLKEQNAVRRKIRQQLEKGPRTVPAIAEAISLSTDETLIHLMGMRKYGELAEDEQDGDYFKYSLLEKTDE